MAAIVQVFAIHKIIFGDLPAAWLHFADGTTLFRRHQICADTGISRAAAPQVIQITVVFKGFTGQIRSCKVWDIAIYNGIWLPGIGRDSRKIHVDLCARADFRAGWNCGKTTAGSRQFR